MLAQPTILVVGNTSTSVALEDLTALAFDVADRLQVPAQVAVGMDYAVTDFAGVVLSGDYLDSVPSAVLGTEALEADLFVIRDVDLDAYASDERCGHCGEGGDAAPVLVGDTWTTSIHASCADEARRSTSATKGVPVAA
ncbi:hypothetical protein [Streptomyces chartreusis]